MPKSSNVGHPHAELKDWRDKVSAAIPGDFSEVLQKDPSEWPEAVATVIRFLVKREEMTLECADALTKENDTLRFRNAEMRRILLHVWDELQDDPNARRLQSFDMLQSVVDRINGGLEG